MRIGEAVAALGIEQPEGQEIVIAIPKGRAWAHYRLAEVADRELDGKANIYIASGTFRAGTVSRYEGRSEANIAEILWLPFDADLSIFMGCDKGDLYGLDDETLMGHVERLRVDLEEVFARVGLPIHRLDYTGYGLCAYVRVARSMASDVAAVRRAHKALVERINEIAGEPILDAQVKDAGTRVTRLPGCLNTKGAIPRTSRTLYQREGAVGPEVLGAAREVQAPPRVVIPPHSTGLSREDADGVVAAVEPHWNEGARHAIALGLGGMLAKAGVPEEQAVAMVERLSEGDPEALDRMRAVRTSYARVQAGNEARGFMSLRDLIPAPALAYVDQVLGRLRQASTARIITSPVRLGRTLDAPAGDLDDARREAVMDDLLTDPGEECFYGIFRTYTEIMRPSSEACDQFHLAAMWTVAGAMIGRNVTVEWFGESLYPNLFTVLIGRTGRSRKDTAIKRALSVPQKQFGREVLTVPFQVHRDVSSAEGLIQVLKNAPNTLLYLTEVTAMLSNARRKGTSTILDRMIEAWDTPDVLQNLNKNSPIEARRPYLSVIAATQPARLANNLTQQDIESGFANRWLFVPGKGKDPMSRAPAPNWNRAFDEVFAPLHAAVNKMAGKELTLTPEAEAAYDAWFFGELARDDRDEAEDDMRARHANLAIKLALIHAVSDEAAAIEGRHIEPAIAYIEWMWAQVSQMMKFWGVGIDSQIAQRIINQLSKHGAMKRRELQMRTSDRRWGPREFAAVFDAMVRNETIAVNATGWVGFPES